MPATSTKPLMRRMSCARVASLSRSISASGSRAAGTATTKVSKSSWSCSPVGVVMRGPRGEIVLGRRLHAEQHVDVDGALAGRGDLDRARQRRGDLGPQAIEPFRLDEVRLVEQHEIGAEELVLVDFLERIVVVERRIGGALFGDARRIVGEAPLRHGGRVDDRHHAVDGEPRAQLRPVEGLDQRLRQGEARRLDDDVVGLRLAREQSRHGRDEIVGDGAADAAVGEFDDRLARAGVVGAALQKLAVDADVAEFVDDQREPAAAGVGEDVADEGRLAGAEKAGDDGDGGLGEHAQGLSGGSGKRRRARDDALAEGKRSLAPGNEPVGRGGVALRGRHDILDVFAAVEVADDIGPFAGRGERDGAGPLADGQAFDRAERDRLAREPRAERLVERRADRARRRTCR